MTISLPWLSCFIVLYTAVVVIIDRIVMSKAKGRIFGSVSDNLIPDVIPPISEDQMRVVLLYQNEWKTVIETQMHFNDLIIRFRSIVLTVFITLVGASIALINVEIIEKEEIIFLCLPIAVLWITAFMMDFFYYHRLLLGSVAQAVKFDESRLAKDYGLFGLTTSIKKSVHPPASKIMVILFYGIPAISMLVLILLKYFYL